MAILAPNLGEIEMLKRILNFSATGNVLCRLFRNNYTPVETSSNGNFTQATAAGYAAKTINGTAWSIVTDGSGFGHATAPQQSFIYSAAETVYGVYFTNAGNTITLWAERFSDAPYNIPGGGGTVNVTPHLRLE